MSMSNCDLDDDNFTFVSVFGSCKTYERKELDQQYFIMRKWCTDRLKVHKEYAWSKYRYEVQHRYGKSTYPYGVYFLNAADALAFKMAFGL